MTDGTFHLERKSFSADAVSLSLVTLLAPAVEGVLAVLEAGQFRLKTARHRVASLHLVGDATDVS